MHELFPDFHDAVEVLGIDTAVVINKNISPQSPLLHNIDTDMIGSSWLRRKITKF